MKVGKITQVTTSLGRFIREAAAAERQIIRFGQTFRAIAPTRKERKRVDVLARQLLVWHIARGHTLETLETMIKRM